MQKNLKTKLENMSKEQLLALMDELCQLPDVRKMVKAMVSPNKNDIEDYYELIGEMISDLSVNMQQHPNEFTADERKHYAEIAGE